jgi:Amt family ammonium transporter
MVALLTMGWIYPLIVAWSWGGGYLYEEFDVSYVDDAGAGVVHLVAGTFGLILTLLLSARKGIFEDYTSDKYKISNGWRGGYSSVYVFWGKLMFLISLLALPGAQTTSQRTFGRGLLNLWIAGMISGTIGAFLKYDKTKTLPEVFLGVLYGIIAGFVAASGSCMSMDPWEAFICGVLGGLIYALGTLLTKKMKIDEPTDGVSCHFLAAFIGVLAPAFFNKNEGVFHEGDGNLIGV